MMLYLNVIMLLVQRDVGLYLQRKMRIVSSLVRPLLWLWILGFGFDAMLKVSGEYDYQHYILPGMLCLSLLFGCIIAALGMVQEQQSGLMRLLLTAPIHRAWIIIAKLISASVIGLLQVAVLMLVLIPFGYFSQLISITGLLMVLLLTALCCSSIGLMLAAFMKNFQGFATVMNFVIFPMFFLSGALYPTTKMPDLLSLAIILNPFAHCVSLNHSMFGISVTNTTSMTVSISYILLSMTVFTTIAIIRFLRNYRR